MKPSCMNCRFSNFESIGKFTCRFQPPLISRSWPDVDQGDWCGQYVHKDTREDETFDITEAPVSADLGDHFRDNLEQLACAFMKLTGLDATDVVLVHRISAERQEVYFRPRTVSEQKLN